MENLVLTDSKVTKPQSKRYILYPNPFTGISIKYWKSYLQEQLTKYLM